MSVPAYVKGGDGKPLHHGIVERCYDKLQAIIQMYVLDKQEAWVYVCTPTMYAFTVVWYSSLSSQSRVVWCYNHCRVNTPTEEIKFGDASPVIRDNRDKIVFDEFEYDVTSMRRTGQFFPSSDLPYVHPPPVHIR